MKKATYILHCCPSKIQILAIENEKFSVLKTYFFQMRNIEYFKISLVPTHSVYSVLFLGIFKTEKNKEELIFEENPETVFVSHLI